MSHVKGYHFPESDEGEDESEPQTEELKKAESMTKSDDGEISSTQKN